MERKFTERKFTERKFTERRRLACTYAGGDACAPKRKMWFRGSVGTNQFKIADIELDPRVFLRGVVKADGDETRIDIRARLGIVELLGSIFLGLVATCMIMVGLGGDYSVVSFLGLTVMVVCVPVLHGYAKSVFWYEVDQTLELLCVVLNAEVVSRTHD